jgi:uncharacterized protein with PQ loop repeat
MIEVIAPLLNFLVSFSKFDEIRLMLKNKISKNTSIIFYTVLFIANSSWIYYG